MTAVAIVRLEVWFEAWSVGTPRMCPDFNHDSSSKQNNCVPWCIHFLIATTYHQASWMEYVLQYGFDRRFLSK